jgi:hypothetical protein
VAGTTADNEVMQQDFVFEDQKNNEVRNSRRIILIVQKLKLQLSDFADILVSVINR